MSQLGLGVMINRFCGYGDSPAVLAGSIGKTISYVTLGNDDALHLVFDDASKIKLYDDGQSCCESRYMRTDDDLTEFVGAMFLGLEIKEAPDIESGYDSHEVQFLEVKTDKGVFTMASHNEHNGYYGGFSIVVENEQ